MARGRYTDAKFEDSLGLIRAALEWSERQDVEKLRRFLLESANVPLYCFSSGGSSASNDYLSLLYETNMGMAKSLTPLAMASISDATLKSAKIVILSNSGNGVDVDYMVKRTVKVNPQGVCGISGCNADNKLIQKLKAVTDNWFKYNIPHQDAFISTDASIAKFGLFYKTFTNDGDFVSKLDFDLTPSRCFTYAPRVEGDIPSLKSIKNYIVLYGGWSRPIAVDFESKMIESGIAAVQLCDYRNFCHGRFMFLSRHFEDSALVLLLTPREKEFAKRLIFEGKTNMGNRDIFPKNTPIITVETELDTPLATIDLLIKEQVLFNEVAKANGVEPCNPYNPNGIEKYTPRSVKWGVMGDMNPLNHGSLQGTVGTLKGVSRKQAIDYDPTKSVAEIARKNNVAVSTVRKYIQDKGIDRTIDERMNAYNRVWFEYIKDSDISHATLAKKLKMSVNTVKQYLNEKAENIKPQEGKIGMVVEHPKVKELREDVLDLRQRFKKFCKVRDKYADLSAGEYLKLLHWSDDRKGRNLAMVINFMQMKEFKYRFKDRDIEYIHN